MVQQPLTSISTPKIPSKIVILVITFLFLLILGGILFISFLIWPQIFDFSKKPTQLKMNTAPLPTIQKTINHPTVIKPNNNNIPQKNKYTSDTDGDSIPDFVETATQYDKNQDECLLLSCNDSTGSAKSTAITNILFILDSSGSMAQTIGSEEKMTAAKNALQKVFAALPQNVNAGLMVYGHKGSNSLSDKTVSCNGIEVLYSLDSHNINAFSNIVNTFQPTGWTPIGGAFRKAKDIFLNRNGQRNIIFLVTDGIETCESNPEGTIKELQQSKIDPIVDIVGFGVNSQEQTVLKNLSKLGNGQFFLAEDIDRFNEIFQNFQKSLLTLQCNQNNNQAYIACVSKRADKANEYLNNINQSIYLNFKPYNNVQASIEDSHEDIVRTVTNINTYRNQAGQRFSDLLKQASQFFGEKYNELINN